MIITTPSTSAANVKSHSVSLYYYYFTKSVINKPSAAYAGKKRTK